MTKFTIEDLEIYGVVRNNKYNLILVICVTRNRAEFHISNNCTFTEECILIVSSDNMNKVLELYGFQFISKEQKSKDIFNKIFKL